LQGLYRRVCSDGAAGRHPRETGSTHDCSGFEPTFDEFKERYDTDELQAVLADAGFDSQENRNYCQDSLDCPLLGAIDPRRLSLAVSSGYSPN